jgi:TPR repeat protein
VFEEDPIDALAYFALAEELGHKYAATAKGKVEELVNGKSCSAQQATTASAPSGASYERYCAEIKEAADSMAELWEPPFEVYPKPYSDESRVDTLKEAALARIGKIECAAFQRAMREIGFYRGEVDNACGPATRKSTLAYQASLGGPVTGELTPAQAVKLIRTAAVNGFASSQFTLGYMYHYGYGVPVSYPRARTWFEKAANQRHPYALYNLGILYRDGLGVRVDFSQAATYFLAAREAGYPRKQEIACRLKEVNWPDESAKGSATCPEQAAWTASPRAKPTDGAR